MLWWSHATARNEMYVQITAHRMEAATCAAMLHHGTGLTDANYSRSTPVPVSCQAMHWYSHQP